MKDNFYNKSFFILVYSGLLNKMTMFSKYVINAYGNSEIYNIRNTALKKMRTLLSNSIIIAHKSSHVVVDWNTVLFRSGFFNLSCAFVPLFFHRVYRYIANSKIKMVMSDMKNDILNGGLALWEPY